MTKRVTFKAKTGEAQGELAEPAGSGKAPGVVLIQEYWGVNDHIRSLVDRLAAAGFVTLAPDLYHGKVTKNAEEAGKIMQGMDRAKAVEEIGAAAKYLAENPRCNGKVAVMGFCMGGGFALAAAAAFPEFKAVVPFYGLPPMDQVDWSKLHAPVLGHYCATDQWAKVDLAKEVQKKLQAHGTPMEVHVYDANHAFVNDTRPEVHNPALAKQAWDRSVTFLHKQLG